MQTALEEKNVYINKLLREEGFKKKNRPFSSNDEGLKKNVEDLRKTVSKLTHEKEALTKKLSELEKSKRKDSKPDDVYKKELQKVSEELEQYRHFVKDNTILDMSLRKKNDIIRLENELRIKNKYIDTLLDTIKDIKGKSSNTSVNKSINSNPRRLSSKYEYRSIHDSSKISLNK